MAVTQNQPMKCWRLSLPLLSLLACPLLANASPPPEHWIGLTTPQFQMYTTNPKDDALRELEFFEKVRSALLKIIPVKTTRPTAVQIVAFRSENEFNPYRFQAGGSAYYLRTFDREYIVLDDINPAHRQLMVHEFTHVIVADAGLQLPIWLNEGLAELYSSIDFQDEQVTVGRPLARHLTTLSRHPWMDWNALFAVGRDSPYYNESDKMSIFYAQSWALTHMLALSEAYAPRFNAFLADISSGMASAAALQTIYGKSMAQIAVDLKAYLHRKPLPETVFDDKLQNTNVPPRIAEPSDFQIDFVLANLLSAKPSTLPEAQAELAALAAKYPDKPEPEESLGYLALQSGRNEEARAHFAIAVQRHSHNPEILYQYAELQEHAGAQDDRVMALLKQALAIEPDSEDVRVAVGLLLAKDFECESALSMLSALTPVPPSQAYAVYSVMARCNLELNHPKIAKTCAEKAKLAAADDNEKQQSDDLLRKIAQN